jgi:TRAP-type C4-dicarboxylate transport system permease small subunit
MLISAVRITLFISAACDVMSGKYFQMTGKMYSENRRLKNYILYYFILIFIPIAMLFLVQNIYIYM